MGPSCRSRKTRSTRKSSSRRKTLFKNQPRNSKNQENPTPDMSIANENCKDSENAEEMCSTPKAERYRIPEIETCPPAPKKRRMSTNNFSLRRTSISFFSHPDIELFFNFALCGVIPI
ncbi:hypothetical protein PHJA_002022600 [Phtheirospermum japonicum]|uniref:Uncharacterized protein n=1 Tax=Phtheirospermum japonicum TaxID=374723 RepID=A0A830CDH7_9LAMI|nr:hypothetical protein PHJA_002022600 [Phtheirospermum japonicum]